jgi:hypothetical protein
VDIHEVVSETNAAGVDHDLSVFIAFPALRHRGSRFRILLLRPVSTQNGN